MAIVINGSGTVTGISVGGLPDSIVDDGTLATNSVTAAKLKSDAITGADLPSGSILQVVTAAITGTTNSSSQTYVASVMNIAITPTLATSRILVMVTGGMNGFAGGSGGQEGRIKLYKDVAGGGYSVVENSTRGLQSFYKTSPDDYDGVAIHYYDDPNTTSTITYNFYILRQSGNGTFSINRDGNGRMNITAFEIAHDS
tara:strand:+ start:9 stop:605 length:597 start_codon:yes stop_codon:yes gene_type:complete